MLNEVSVRLAHHCVGYAMGESLSITNSTDKVYESNQAACAPTY